MKPVHHWSLVLWPNHTRSSMVLVSDRKSYLCIIYFIFSQYKQHLKHILPLVLETTHLSVCMSGLIKVCIKMDHFFCLIKWVKTTVCLFIFPRYEWGTPGYGHWAIFIQVSPNECLTTLQLWLKAVNGSQEMLKLLFCFVTGEQLMTSNLYKFIGLNMFHIFFWSRFHSNFTQKELCLLLHIK